MADFGVPGPSRERSGFVFDREVPADLHSALVIALSTLPGLNLEAAAQPPYVGTVISDLVRATCRFATRMKADREPPENVLIALKTIVRRVGLLHPHDAAIAEEVQRIVVLESIKAYYEHPRTGTSAPPAPPADASTTKPLILVVDDDEDARFIARSYLSAFGYGVVVAADGRDILNLARRVRPAAIVLDILLPHLDGRAVIQLLKSDPTTRSIPTIALTGVQEIAESPLLVADGFVDVLLKPMRQAELLRAVEAALR